MSKPRTLGFTLIELLTVIAIIAILVGITAAVLPGVLERSKVTRTEADFAQVRTALVAYSVDNSSFPPGYGYRQWRLNEAQAYAAQHGQPPANFYNLLPYMEKIKLINEVGLYDQSWADSYDTNRNGTIDALEFFPIPDESLPGRYPTLLYIVDDPLNSQVQQMGKEQPPYAYFPVNKAQAEKFRKFCERDKTNLNRIYAREWVANDPLLSTIQFPPAVYDAFVLISPGPGGSTFGVIPSNADMWGESVVGPYDIYYANALRVYYLATRDLNNNKVPDFDFRARTRQGETDYLLPDNSNEEGPLIFVGG